MREARSLREFEKAVFVATGISGYCSVLQAKNKDSITCQMTSRSGRLQSEKD